MDKRDVAMQASMPSMMVPRYGKLQAAETFGERLLIASNGVFLEVNRVWARFIRRVSSSIATPLPYGEQQSTTEWKIEGIPKHLLRQFNDMARAQSHREIGGCIIWNEKTGYRLSPVITLESSGAHLRYQPPPMEAGDHLIIDCHSHARFGACFSKTDDADDAWSVKLAYVVGNCDRQEQSVAMRLCIKGIFETTQLEEKS
ncbi:PRTRC system protein A [Noviherbaspirillum pedocola]|uniref:PRTRC system protein A n=1 Tax=Noviherbaspirillum pedocola TaxID=2801341 RepID=A0A934W6C3_9BURK|nr:PRTRC system protein A [Noviherbaspirillum pedocola]MBK4736047.1 PRTRC system protein A [Noviherbaspirillum pedocola]